MQLGEKCMKLGKEKSHNLKIGVIQMKGISEKNELAKY
jgi:hypothetical protein